MSTETVNVAVELEGVSVVRGGRTIWSSGSFAIPRGAIVGVIGPNGSGKTTLLELLLGLVPPASGTIDVLGAPPKRGNERIGYVPQNYAAAVGDAVRCRDLVSLGRSGTRWGVRGGDRAARERVTEALAAVGASGVADRRLSRLSGGQQQRVGIAQALVGDPELLLLDEPLASLDVRNQHEVVRLLQDLQAARGVTILIVAHDLNPLVSALSGAVYLLDGHPHYDEIGSVVDAELLTHLYGAPIKVVRTAQGDLFTRSG